MKLRQLFTLAVILGLLVLGVVVKQSQKRPELATREYTLLNLSFDKDRVSKMTINDDQVQLVKENVRWQAVNFFSARADQKKIDDFLSEIRNAQGELRASGQDILKDFGITDEEGIRVTLGERDQETLGFVLGTKKGAPGTSFIRKKDSQDVYLTEANLLGMMGIYGDASAEGPQADYWVSKNLADYDPNQVNRIEIKNFEKGAETGSTGLQKEGGVWKFLRADLPFAPSADKAEQYLSGAKTYMASQVLDPQAQDYGFSKPHLRIKLALEKGREIIITAGNPDTPERNSYYLQVSSEAVVFLLSKYYLENLSPDDSWFFSDNPLSVDPAKTAKLVVRADQTEMKFEPAAKKWDALTSYLESLKNFRVEQPISKKPKFGKYRLEIQKQGEAPVILDFADLSSKDKKEYAVQKSGNPYVFSVSETLFRQLFDNPGRLAEPAK